MNAVLNWSGGKDSSLTLHYLNQSKEYDVKYLLTSVSSQYQRISMHGVRIELLKTQAKSLGIPLRIIEMPEEPTMTEYDALMRQTLGVFKREGIRHSIFGDIFLEDLKKYREDQLAKVDFKGVFPLWLKSTQELVKEFIDLGFKAVLVCVNEKFLDQSFVGRIIDHRFVKDLPANVDPCGENGEFHTFVYDGPIFKAPISFEKGEVVYRKYKMRESDNEAMDQVCPSSKELKIHTGFWYCDLLPSE